MAQRVSVLSSPYLRYGVGATVNGAVVPPVGDAVSFAFVQSGTDPVNADWKVGSWETQAGPPTVYVARIQLGPLGTVQLTKGRYQVWIRIVDSPETIIQPVGELDIT